MATYPPPVVVDERFSVQCVFRSHLGEPATYEERVTLWRAKTFEEAVALAEDEAREYAGDIEAEYIGSAQAYRLAEAPAHGTEVFSLMRDSTLLPDEYLNTFFDTGAERQGTIPGE